MLVSHKPLPVNKLNYPFRMHQTKSLTTSVIDLASLFYCIGITKIHLVVRSEERLKYEKDLPKSVIKTHLKGCHVCRITTIDNFEINQ